MTAAETADPLDELLADLAVETAALVAVLERLSPDEWASPTPAPGWAVADQVTHLLFFDEAAAMAVQDPGRFRAHAAELQRRGPDFAGAVAADLRTLRPEEVLARFTAARAALISTYSGQDRRRRVPWYGPEMSLMSAATARLMETWAHGVDVADALGAPLATRPGLRHVAHLGYSTRRFCYANRGQEPPGADPLVELGAGDGAAWVFGSPGATDRVVGGALDFCLVVTQRRTVEQTGLDVTGSGARSWMAVAQAFAGPPTTTTRLPVRF